MRFFHLLETIQNSYTSYTAIVLDELSRQLLYKRFNKIIPENWKFIAHHMTINMEGANKGPAALLLNKQAELTGIALASSDKAIAIEVESVVPSLNPVKHITLAVSPSGKPSDSRDLTNWQKIKPIKLNGIVQEVQVQGSPPAIRNTRPQTLPAPSEPEAFVKYLAGKPIEVIQKALKNKFPKNTYTDEEIKKWLNK